VAGFTDRENEGPTELPMVERCQHEPRRRQPWRTSATDACKHPESLPTPRQPRSAAGTLSRLALAHLPAIATRRRRRFVAGFTDRENEGPAELPTIEHRQHGPRRRQPWRTPATEACEHPESLTRPRHA